MKMSKSDAGKLGRKKSLILSEQNYKKRLKEYYIKPTYCMECNIILSYNRKKNTFCSKSCSITYNNKLRKKFNKCENCGKDINKPKKYCNNKCQQDKLYKDKTKNLNGDLNDLSKGAIKRFLTEKYGYKCSECGISEWNNKKIVLELEHKDGHSENNKEENLCFLCPNCHSQTDTYKGKNKGNGRYYRRLRYQQSKSY